LPTFPDFNIDEHLRTQKWANSVVDAGVADNVNRNMRLKQMNLNYLSHNGVDNSKAYAFITNAYGKKSRTKFIDYKMMRTKIKQLEGEFLSTPITATVASVNADAINEKLDNAYFLLGAAHAKPQIEDVKQTLGVDPTEGMDVPAPSDPNLWKLLAPQGKNEVVMQRIVNTKVKKDKIKQEFLTNTTDVLIAAECFGKIEKDKTGKDVYRAIDPRYALFQESYGDWMLKRTPYIGEYQEKYIYEIIRDEELSEKDILTLKSCCNSTNSTEFTNLGIRLLNNIHAAEVYTLQWRSVTRIVTKTSPAKPIMGLDGQPVQQAEPIKTTIPSDVYSENIESITNDVKKGLYTLEIAYKEDVYENKRIGKMIYTKFKKLTDQIQTKGEGRYYNAQYDYCGMLYSTVDGLRISMQELGNELQAQHNMVMFMINRELNKMKGNIIAWDKAFIPGGETYNGLMFKVTEDGIFAYDSSEDGANNDKRNSGLGALTQLNIGDHTILEPLLTLKKNLEDTADSITGITAYRGGDIQASSTVGNAQQNVSASKSMTQDIFYLLNEYFENVLMKLCEKTKLNTKWLEAQGATVLGTDAVQFIKASAELGNDEYEVTLSDGYKENEIRKIVRQFFPVEINAGQLRSKDVIRFELNENIREALAVLDNASAEINKLSQQQKDNELTQENTALKQQLQKMATDKTAQYDHEKEIVVLQTEGKKEEIALKGQIDHGKNVMQGRNQALQSQMDKEHEMEMAQKQQQNDQQNNQNKSVTK